MTFNMTPGEARQLMTHQVVKEALGDKYIRLKLINTLKITEDLEKSETKIACEVQRGDTAFLIEGSGKGPVDAFYSSLSDHLSDEYCTLSDFYFSEFGIQADLLKKHRRSGSDAHVESLLVIRSYEGDDFIFREQAHSVINASVLTALSAIEYFINLEEAVVATHDALYDAKKRKRSDLANTYLMRLIQLVDKSSYQETLRKRGRIKRD